MKIELGSITDFENDELRLLFSKKTALIELMRSLENNSAEKIYDKIVTDLAAANDAIAAWWEKTSAKYNWTFSASDTWSVDFKSKIAYLNTPLK